METHIYQSDTTVINLRNVAIADGTEKGGGGRLPHAAWEPDSEASDSVVPLAPYPVAGGG